MELASGEIVNARRAVLADVPAPQLYADLVGAEHLPPRLLADLENFQWDAATLKIDWALSGPVPWTAREAPVRPAPCTSASTSTAFPTTPTDLATRRDPTSPVHPLRSDDDQRSATLTGRHRVGLGVHPPAAGRADDPERVARHVERVTETVERHAPGFSRLVVGIERAVAGRCCSSRIRRSSAVRSTAAPRNCISNWCFVRSPASAGRRPRSTGSTSPAPPPIPAAACTAGRAPTPHGPRSSGPERWAASAALLTEQLLRRIYA